MSILGKIPFDYNMMAWDPGGRQCWLSGDLGHIYNHIFILTNKTP